MKDNKEKIRKKLLELLDNEEYELIEETVTALPDSLIDDKILEILCSAYFNLEEYKKAVALLEGQRERLENDCMWNFRMGLALLKVSEDEECEDNEELKTRVLERAQLSFARSINLNPPEEMIDVTSQYMEMTESALDELYGNDDAEDGIAPEMYSEDEIEAIEEHILKHFGDTPTIFHEIVSPDIHCDIYTVPPTKERNYYTLITVGMGAHIMDLPKELDSEQYGRAELLICLPPDWKVGERENKWFWPISLIKRLSRLPINCETWLGWGHTVDNRNPFAENTKLCGSILLYPDGIESDAEICVLPNGEIVNFYEVIPLYREEMVFKQDNSTLELVEKMLNCSHIVNPDRENSCEGYFKSESVDSSSTHSKKITKKNLPLDMINGCNHIAAYLRWCIEHDLHALEFQECYPEVIEGVKSGNQTDLRDFIENNLGGEISLYQLNLVGSIFTRDYYCYYNSDDIFNYPRDVDSSAEEYFGSERYNSEEFQDEEYLFMPFDEEYYKRISKYIDRAFQDFYSEFSQFEYDRLAKSVKTAEEILGCECIFTKEPDDIVKELKKALSDCDEEGWFPLLMIIDFTEDEMNAEELEWLLRCSVDKFCRAVAIAKTPKDFLKKFTASEPAVLKSEEIEAHGARLKEIYGVKPAVLEIFSDSIMLMLPRADGGYSVLKGERNDRA